MARSHPDDTGEFTSSAEPNVEINSIVDDFLKRRITNPTLSHEELLREHPQLKEELSETLRRLELIDTARLFAQGRQKGGVPGQDESDPSTRPRTLGRFELVQVIGVGGFGAVWHGRDNQLHRDVAIKVPRQTLVGHSLHDFLREARLTAQLKHKHIVKVYEIGESEGTVFIVSDLIDGLPLNEWVAEHPLSSEEIARLCKKLADAMHHAHQQGIVHRDLKPGNILVDAHGEPAITDFGLAKQRIPDETVTQEGRILGTPAYMSPEQAAGKSSEADARADVYSLGVVLFELLTGERPFRGKSAMLIHHVMQSEPPLPRSLNAEIPRDLETICLKCLEKDSDKRYQTAANLAAELDRFLRGEPIKARPITRATRLARWCLRNPELAGAVALAVVLLISLVAAGWWFYLDERRDRTELLSALEQENMIRQAFLQTEDFARFRSHVEQVANDATLTAGLAALAQDTQWNEWLAELRPLDAVGGSPPGQKLQIKVTEHRLRQQLQAWLEQTAETQASLKTFAWFILDQNGTQVARAPPDAAVGRNYAWRTYFHGGPRDYRDYADYEQRCGEHISATYLSRGVFTNVTHRHVVVVSTPIEQNGTFLGVLGLMVELHEAANAVPLSMSRN